MGATWQWSARAARRANSIARSLITGSVPGIPVHTSQTAVLGPAEAGSTTGQAQNIFDLVCNSAWTSRPITGSKPGPGGEVGLVVVLANVCACAGEK